MWKKGKRKKRGGQKKEKGTQTATYAENHRTGCGLNAELNLLFLPAKAAARESAMAGLEELSVGAFFRFLRLSLSLSWGLSPALPQRQQVDGGLW